jgi:hypothetical protein
LEYGRLGRFPIARWTIISDNDGDDDKLRRRRRRRRRRIDGCWYLVAWTAMLGLGERP